MKRVQSVVLAVLLLSGFIAYAEAGVVITSIDTSFADPRDSGRNTAYIGDIGMRAETRSEGGNTTLIFRADKEVLWIIDAADKTYTEMTKKDIKQMKDQMNEAMRIMQEQMKNIPPEQRAMVEQMMKGQSMPEQPEKTVFKKVASGITVNKWKADKYEGHRRGRLTEEVWTTSWRNFGIDQNDFKVMQKMGEFMSHLSPDAASQFNVGSDEWEKEQGYPGVPVRTISYSQGKKVYQTEIENVKKQKLDPSLFELPKGLMKQSFSAPLKQ